MFLFIITTIILYWLMPYIRLFNLHEWFFHKFQVRNLPYLQECVKFTWLHFSWLWYSHEHRGKWVHAVKTWYTVFQFEIVLPPQPPIVLVNVELKYAGTCIFNSNVYFQAFQKGVSSITLPPSLSIALVSF